MLSGVNISVIFFWIINFVHFFPSELSTDKPDGAVDKTSII